MDWPTGALGFLLPLAVVALGLAIGRWLRLVRRFDLIGVNRALLTVAQGLVLLAILGGLDQRPLPRALAFTLPMALAWGLLTALAPGGEPTGRWWQLWRWSFAPPKR